MSGDVRFVVVSLPVVVAAWYGALGVVAFVLYARDKRAARRGGRRTPETTLLGIDLLGGWIGGLLAQRLLRHKTAKTSFQRRFALCVVINLVLAWWLVREALPAS